MENNTFKNVQLTTILNGRQLTPAIAAWLLLHYPRNLWRDENECNYLRRAIEPTVRDMVLPLAGEIVHPRCDPRIDSIIADKVSSVNSNRVRVFTEYTKLSDSYTGENVDFVDSHHECSANVLVFLYPVKNYLSFSISQIICQFPYEGGLVSKDLLPLTVRRFCYKDGNPPYWWLPCFDLSTEFHLFSQEYYHRVQRQQANSWILKPATGTKAKGHIFIPSLTELSYPQSETSNKTELKSLYSDEEEEDIPIEVLHSLANIATMCPILQAGREALKLQGQWNGDRVAQLLVERPLLVDNRKFDLRFFVIVKSFIPFEAYVHNLSYARLATHTYLPDLSKALADPLSSLTVCCYDDDPSVAKLQERMFTHELVEALQKERPELAARWDDTIIPSVYRMLSELFGGSAPSIGRWPCSRAYYGVDVIFDDGPFFNASQRWTDKQQYNGDHELMLDSIAQDVPIADTETTSSLEQGMNTSLLPVPKLLEVNFMADWSGMEGVSGESSVVFQSWVNDMVDCLATDKPISLDRMHKL